MTPKEHAIELVDLFKPLVHKNFNYVDDGEKDKAKQCAIIISENMIKQLSELTMPEMIDFYHGKFAGQTISGTGLIEYWEAVKKEIESL